MYQELNLASLKRRQKVDADEHVTLRIVVVGSCPLKGKDGIRDSLAKSDDEVKGLILEKFTFNPFFNFVVKGILLSKNRFYRSIRCIRRPASLTNHSRIISGRRVLSRN